MMMLAALVVTTQFTTAIAPIDLLEGAGFRTSSNRQSKRMLRLSGSGQRESPPSSVSWRIDAGLSRMSDFIPDDIAAQDGLAKKVPSALPIGSSLRFQRSGGSLVLHALTAHEWVSVSILLQGRDERGHYRAPQHDWTADEKFAERFARTALARTAGVRLGAVSNRSFGGYSAKAATCQSSGRIFVDLGEWATRHGWSSKYDRSLAYFTLRKGSSWIVLPAGSPKVKINGEWRNLEDVLMQKDGRWMIVESDLHELQ